MTDNTTILETAWVLNFSNYPIWVFGFWATILFIGYNAAKRQKQGQVLFLILGIFTMFVPYILISWIRSTFAYYFIYTIPFITPGSVLFLDSIKDDRFRIITKIILLASSVGMFVWLFPLKIFGWLR